VSYYFAVVRQHDDQLLGSCYVSVQAQQQGEIGYILGVDYWGQGYATEAARCVLAFGFETLQLHRTFADVVCENHGSVRVLERLGMQREARLLETQWFHNRWWDTCIYAALAREWTTHD
jgi:RimJ/RimL family protein N-acetyltransferase